jgi:hypothetical protein
VTDEDDQPHHNPDHDVAEPWDLDLSRVELDPLPLLRALPEPVPFPVEALGPLRAATEALHDITQAPIAICWQSVFGVAALAAQGLVDVETLHGRSPCSVYLLTIAQSGERKSTCDRLVMQPVRAYEQELADARRDALASYRNRRELWDADRRRIINGKKGDPAARHADPEALGPVPQEPLHAEFVAAEPTLEGITKNMSALRASLGIFSDEGGTFLGGHSMSSENRMRTISGLSALWDGSATSRWRAGDGVASHAGRRVTMHLMVQPVVAAELLADRLSNGQGFLARCLITAPPSAVGTRTRIGHLPESPPILERFSARILELLGSPQPLRDGSRNELDPPLLPLSDEARRVLQDFAIQVEEAQLAGGPLDSIPAFASKAPEHAARLAAVKSVYAGEPEVSESTMENAILLARYYIQEAKRLTDASKVSKGTSEAETMRLWLQEKWTEPYISIPDATQYGPNSLRETIVVARIFQTLEQHRYLIRVEGGALVRGKFRRLAWMVECGGPGGGSAAGSPQVAPVAPPEGPDGDIPGGGVDVGGEAGGDVMPSDTDPHAVAETPDNRRLEIAGPPRQDDANVGDVYVEPGSGSAAHGAEPTTDGEPSGSGSG